MNAIASLDLKRGGVIHAPGHEFHGRTVTIHRVLANHRKALVHVYDHVYVCLPLTQIKEIAHVAA